MASTYKDNMIGFTNISLFITLYLERKVGEEPWKDWDDTSDKLRKIKEKLNKMKREFNKKQNLQSKSLTA